MSWMHWATPAQSACPNSDCRPIHVITRIGMRVAHLGSLSLAGLYGPIRDLDASYESGWT